MKFGVLNKTTTENRFVLHTLQRNITHLAVITRKTNIKLGILKGGKLEKSRFLFTCVHYSFPIFDWLCLYVSSDRKKNALFF